MINVISKLAEYAGRYQGEGINHDDQQFIGELVVSPIEFQNGVAIEFIAKGADGVVFHQENSMIAANAGGGVSLWTLNNNVPYQYEHSLYKVDAVEGAEATFSFRHGDESDNTSFREIVSIDFWPDKSLTYRYAWGMPEGEFRDRSGVRMTKKL